jgi:hypothetical protein
MKWSATKAGRVLRALYRIGWAIKRQNSSSHRTLSRPGWPDYVFAFGDSDELGPRILARALPSILVFDLTIFDPPARTIAAAASLGGLSDRS